MTVLLLLIMLALTVVSAFKLVDISPTLTDTVTTDSRLALWVAIAVVAALITLLGFVSTFVTVIRWIGINNRDNKTIECWQHIKADLDTPTPTTEVVRNAFSESLIKVDGDALSYDGDVQNSLAQEILRITELQQRRHDIDWDDCNELRYSVGADAFSIPKTIASMLLVIAVIGTFFGLYEVVSSFKGATDSQKMDDIFLLLENLKRPFGFNIIALSASVFFGLSAFFGRMGVDRWVRKLDRFQNKELYPVFQPVNLEAKDLGIVVKEMNAASLNIKTTIEALNVNLSKLATTETKIVTALAETTTAVSGFGATMESTVLKPLAEGLHQEIQSLGTHLEEKVKTPLVSFLETAKEGVSKFKETSQENLQLLTQVNQGYESRMNAMAEILKEIKDGLAEKEGSLADTIKESKDETSRAIQQFQQAGSKWQAGLADTLASLEAANKADIKIRVERAERLDASLSSAENALVELKEQLATNTDTNMALEKASAGMQAGNDRLKKEIKGLTTDIQEARGDVSRRIQVLPDAIIRAVNIAHEESIKALAGSLDAVLKQYGVSRRNTMRSWLSERWQRIRGIQTRDLIGRRKADPWRMGSDSGLNRRAGIREEAKVETHDQDRQ